MSRKTIGFTIFLILCGTALIPVDAITIRHEGKLQYASFINDDKMFSLRWFHSVEKEEWEEFFIIEDEGIKIDSTRFKTFGAGVPSKAGTGSFIKDGWVYMVNIDRVIGESLTIRTGEMTSHRFVSGDHVYSFPSGKNAYDIQEETIPIIQVVYSQLTH